MAASPHLQTCLTFRIGSRLDARSGILSESMLAQIGPYRIEEELGRGAMGIVFRGFDPNIGRTDAIKVIRAPEFATPEEEAEARLRFAREAANTLRSTLLRCCGASVIIRIRRPLGLRHWIFAQLLHDDLHRFV